VPKRILFVVNVDWYFISHRLLIAEAAKQEGFEVYVAASNTGRSHEIMNKGINFIDFTFSRSGINPVKELITLFDFYRLFNTIKADIIHLISLKPVIYGSIIAKGLNINGIVCAISGLGYNFTDFRVKLISKVSLRLLRYGFNNDVNIIFQNNDDYKELYSLSVLSPKNKILTHVW